jgi:hypothetical protein
VLIQSDCRHKFGFHKIARKINGVKVYVCCFSPGTGLAIRISKTVVEQHHLERLRRSFINCSTACRAGRKTPGRVQGGQ